MQKMIFGLVASMMVFGLSSAWLAAADKDKHEWVDLGSRKVDFKHESDRIEVGKEKGKFSHIRFKVEDGDLVMEKIVVYFHNGEKFEPGTKTEFKEGSRSSDIDLPGKGRYIEKVDFFYHSEHQHDPATVTLSGKED